MSSSICLKFFILYHKENTFSKTAHPLFKTISSFDHMLSLCMDIPGFLFFLTSYGLVYSRQKKNNTTASHHIACFVCRINYTGLRN